MFAEERLHCVEQLQSLAGAAEMMIATRLQYELVRLVGCLQRRVQRHGLLYEHAPILIAMHDQQRNSDVGDMLDR